MINRKAVRRFTALSRFFLVIGIVGSLLPTLCRAQTPAKVLFPFQGKIDFEEKKFSLLMTLENKDAVSVEVSRDPSAVGLYRLLVNINHLKTPIFEISSVVESPLEITKNTQGKFRALTGKLWSKYTLVNYQPVGEMSGSFQVQDEALTVSSFSIGNLTGEGSIRFARPFTVNLALNLTEIDIGDFLNFWIKEGTVKGLASGRVSGRIVLSGPLNRLQVKGNFVAYDGVIKGSAFENLAINFEGIYPLMTLVDSTGAKPDGFTFSINGNVDLSDRVNFVQQIRALSKEAIVRKQGDNVEWTLKRTETEGNAKTELKYLKRKGNETGIVSDEEDMVGVERSIQF